MTRPRVDFYVLDNENPTGLWLTACRLIEKIYKQGLTVFACLEAEEEVLRMDDLLWTFRQGSFVPHARYQGPDPLTPVHIGRIGESAPAADVLVNLARTVPENAPQYPRIADLVNQLPEIRALGRARYRRYQAQGFHIDTHTL